MKAFNASFDTVLLRYFLMMGTVIVPFLIGVPYLALLAIPVFLTAIMAIDFRGSKSSGKRTHRTNIKMNPKKAA